MRAWSSAPLPRRHVARPQAQQVSTSNHPGAPPQDSRPRAESPRITSRVSRSLTPIFTPRPEKLGSTIFTGILANYKYRCELGIIGSRLGACDKIQQFGATRYNFSALDGRASC